MIRVRSKILEKSDSSCREGAVWGEVLHPLPVALFRDEPRLRQEHSVLCSEEGEWQQEVRAVHSFKLVVSRLNFFLLFCFHTRSSHTFVPQLQVAIMPCVPWPGKDVGRGVVPQESWYRGESSEGVMWGGARI